MPIPCPLQLALLASLLLDSPTLSVLRWPTLCRYTLLASPTALPPLSLRNGVSSDAHGFRFTGQVVRRPVATLVPPGRVTRDRRAHAARSLARRGRERAEDAEVGHHGLPDRRPGAP